MKKIFTFAKESKPLQHAVDSLLSSAFRASKKRAFTLAEVLITLAIIGVVAAMTIPTLVSKYQENVRVTKLKRAYAEVSQALKLAEAEHGTMESWDFSNYTAGIERNSYFFENYIKPYIKLQKICIPNNLDCWRNDTTGYTDTVSAIAVSGYALSTWVDSRNIGGWVNVDIDGPYRGENAKGKDIFEIKYIYKAGNDVSENLTKPGIFLNGLQFKTQKNRDELKERNDYCGALIFLDGWKMSDDNPCK